LLNRLSQFARYLTYGYMCRVDGEQTFRFLKLRELEKTLAQSDRE